MENICGRTNEVDHLAIPAACFTHPEIAMVGLTEEQAKEKVPCIPVCTGTKKSLFVLYYPPTFFFTTPDEKCKTVLCKCTLFVKALIYMSVSFPKLLRKGTMSVYFGLENEDELLGSTMSDNYH